MAPSLAAGSAPTDPTPATPSRRPPRSVGRLVLLGALSIVTAGLYVLYAVSYPEDPNEPVGPMTAVANLLVVVSFASAVSVAASLMRRRDPQRQRRRPAPSITFRPPQRPTSATTGASPTTATAVTGPSARPQGGTSMDPARYPPIEPRPSLAPAGIAATVAALALAATFALDAASRSAADRACTGSAFPETCRNDAQLPLAALGALCLLVFLGAAVAALVIVLTRGRRRER